MPVPNVDEAQPDQTSLSGKSRMPALPGAECLVVHLSNPGSQAGEPSVSGLGIGVLAGMSYDKKRQGEFDACALHSCAALT